MESNQDPAVMSDQPDLRANGPCMPPDASGGTAPRLASIRSTITGEDTSLLVDRHNRNYNIEA